MEKINIELPQSNANLVSKMVDINNSSYTILDGEEIIRDVSDIVLNGVEIDGNAIRVLGNVIVVGYYKIKPIYNGDSCEEIGKSVSFDFKTGKLWNSAEFNSLSFVRNNLKWNFTFYSNGITLARD